MAQNNEYVFVCDDLPKKCFSFFGKKRAEFCDITFKVGERCIKAHRIILAAAIPYFYLLLSDQEMANSENKEIAFPDIDSGALEALIEYAYNCKVEISMENVKMLLSGACILKVEEVKEACCRFLAERLSSENALDIRYYSSSLGCSGLVEEVDRFIENNFSQMMTCEEFLNMPFSLLNNIISSDQLNVQSEEVVFESAIKWVKNNPDERHDKLPELLKNIRLPLLEPLYIKNHVTKEKLIRSSALCRDLVEEAIFYCWIPEKRNVTGSFCITPRRYVSGDRKRSAEENISVCILRESCVVECFDLVKKKWETRMIHNVPTFINLSESVIALDNKMYCFDENVTHVIDLETNRYSPCRGMRHPSSFRQPVVHTKRIFFCGGRRNGFVSNFFECFEPKTEEWTDLTPMNTYRLSAGAAVWKEFIYVLGGLTSTCVTNYVEKYSVVTGMWSTSSPMLIKRYTLGCCTLNDKIYACGGRDSFQEFSSAEVFDPITDEWKFITSMYTPRWECKLVSCCNKIYVLGGYYGTSCLSTLKIYDPETDAWQHGEPTNEKTRIFGAVVVSVPSI